MASVSADRLSSALARALEARGRRLTPGALLGLEHEYTLRTPTGRRGGRGVDFRELIHELPIDGRRLDPGDANAYRLRSGGVITADGREAEVATPPLRRRPGVAEELERWGRSARGELEQAIGDRARLAGYSTHLSVAVPSAHVETVARLYARTFAPAMQLLLDRRDSPGLLVRPRPGRVELGGEYATGERLRAAALFAEASVRACAKAVASGRVDGLPPIIELEVHQASDRYGWFVGRRATGGDLYRRGRAAKLRALGGERHRAQEQLELSWQSARAALGRRCTAAERDPLEAMISGAAPLACEADWADEIAAGFGITDALFGSPLELRCRDDFLMTAAVATWDLTVFAIVRGGREAFACVPRAYLESFLERLDAGDLDATINAYLDAPPAGRVLAQHGQAKRPGLYDSVGSGRDLLPPELGSPAGGGGASDHSRPAKREADWQAPRKGPKKALVLAALALVLLVAAAGGYALLRGDSKATASADTTPTPSPKPQAEVTPDSSPKPKPVDQAPRVAAIKGVFVQADYTTYYEVTARDPEGKPLRYAWNLKSISDPGCTAFKIPAGKPNRAQWYHRSGGSCTHNLPGGHSALVSVTVSDGTWMCRATFSGSDSGNGTRPACTKT